MQLQSLLEPIPAMKMYILCRLDLPACQRTVQTAHAMAEFMQKHSHDTQVNEWAIKHKTLIVLGIENEIELNRWQHNLIEQGIVSEAFIEPDIGNQKTALAIHPSADPKLFKKLRLLK